MAKRPLPTAEELRQLLRYDADAGKLYWLPRPNDPQFTGQFAGREAFTYTDAQGYKSGRLFDTGITAHRVIWALVHGAWPDGHIDHINGSRTDNRAANLRIATHTENQRNMRRSKANKSGATGVIWEKRRHHWRVEITVDRRNIYLGSFGALEDAKAARKRAERKYGFHENHGRDEGGIDDCNLDRHGGPCPEVRGG